MGNSDAILCNPKACIRAICALKAGCPPKEGIEFLSVGIEDTLKTIDQALQKATQEAVPLWLIGNYGEGKSHTLRLFSSVAKRRRFATVYITHDARELIGLHKPARLFRRILWALRWSYPEIKLGNYEWMLNASSPSYQEEYQFRTALPSHIQELTNLLRQQHYDGLTIFIDEVEDCIHLWHNQHRPAFETLKTLACECGRYYVLCFGVTNPGLEGLRSEWQHRVGEEGARLLQSAPRCAIPLPRLSENLLPELARRIHQVHSVAFKWEPTLSIDTIIDAIREKIRNHYHWRTVAQAIVTELEIAHQQVHRYQCT